MEKAHRLAWRRRVRQVLLLGFGAGLLACAPPATPQHFPPILTGELEVELSTFTEGLAGDIDGEFQISPTDLAPIPDGSGRLAVSTLGGIVRIIDASGNLQPAPLLTKAQTGTQVPPVGEWGMTSVVFHPDFGNVGMPGYGRFYTISTEDPSDTPTDFGQDFVHQDIVQEWTLADHTSPSWGGPGDSMREILRFGQPGGIHNVVDLAFGPDKMLFISVGDGGKDSTGAQDPLTIFGNILRIDPLGDNGVNGQYGIPADNPYADGQRVTIYINGNRNGQGRIPLPEIYAYGCRSPYRMNFDRLTGELYVGDVGEVDIEEINRIVPGGNYGWNSKEGTYRSGYNLSEGAGVSPDTPEANDGGTQTLAEQFGFIDPVFEFDHAEGRCVVGGFVYRGTQIPELQGKYVFADLGQGGPSAKLYYGDPSTTDPHDFNRLRVSPSGESLPSRIISIGEDAQGELYLVAVGQDPRQGGGLDGRIIRILRAALPGDTDGDGDIDDFDLITAITNYTGSLDPGTGGKTPADGDTDGDGDVDDFDLINLISGYTGSLPVGEEVVRR